MRKNTWVFEQITSAVINVFVCVGGWSFSDFNSNLKLELFVASYQTLLHSNCSNLNIYDLLDASLSTIENSPFFLLSLGVRMCLLSAHNCIIIYLNRNKKQQKLLNIIDSIVSKTKNKRRNKSRKRKLIQLSATLTKKSESFYWEQ